MRITSLIKWFFIRCFMFCKRMSTFRKFCYCVLIYIGYFIVLMFTPSSSGVDKLTRNVVRQSVINLTKATTKTYERYQSLGSASKIFKNGAVHINKLNLGESSFVKGLNISNNPCFDEHTGEMLDGAISPCFAKNKLFWNTTLDTNTLKVFYGLQMEYNRAIAYVSDHERSKSPYEFPFLIDGSSICKDRIDIFLVILIPSVHSHIEAREAIRNSWGKTATSGMWPLAGKLNVTVRLAFLFGQGKSELGNSIAMYESKTHGDIVQGDFVDSYFNLTRKMIMGLRWACEYCPQAKYILKADEDVFVHVYNLINKLIGKIIEPTGNMYGHTHVSPDVLRSGKWKVEMNIHPFRTYPTYACGNTYVISGNIACRVYNTAKYMSYVNIEDVFITGLVRILIGADILDVFGFTYWYDKKPVPCEFKNDVRISATKMSSDMQTFFWEELKRPLLKDCYRIIKTVQIHSRPEKGKLSYRRTMRDDHIFYNRTGKHFYQV